MLAALEFAALMGRAAAGRPARRCVTILVDAQLPVRLSSFSPTRGTTPAHARPPSGYRTTDAVIAELADRDDRVVVTKNRDFRDGHALVDHKVGGVASGNITNAALPALFSEHLGMKDR